MDDYDIGDVILDRYEVTDILGQGGMGNVLAAEDRPLGRLVALKFLLASLRDKPPVSARFEREARTATLIVDEHVARTPLTNGTPRAARPHSPQAGPLTVAGVGVLTDRSDEADAREPRHMTASGFRRPGPVRPASRLMAHLLLVGLMVGCEQKAGPPPSAPARPSPPWDVSAIPECTPVPTNLGFGADSVTCGLDGQPWFYKATVNAIRPSEDGATMLVTVTLRRSHCSNWATCAQPGARKSYKVADPSGAVISKGETDDGGVIAFRAPPSIDSLASWNLFIGNRELPGVFSNIPPKILRPLREQKALAALDISRCLKPTNLHGCDLVQEFVDEFSDGPNVESMRRIIARAAPKLDLLRATDAWRHVDQEKCLAVETASACDSVQSFLRTYPTAPEASDAHSVLDQAAPKLAPLREAADWEGVNKEACAAPESPAACDAVRSFLTMYPKSRHATEATALLKRADPKIRTLLARLPMSQLTDEQAAARQIAAASTKEQAARRAYDARHSRLSACECVRRLGKLSGDLNIHGTPVTAEEAVELNVCGLIVDPQWCEHAYPQDCNLMWDCLSGRSSPHCPPGMRETWNHIQCAQVCGVGKPPCPLLSDCTSEGNLPPICVPRGHH